MSRLASQEKGMYYPTPEPVIKMIVQYLSSKYPSGDLQEMRFLDPCVGKGRAMALLAEEYRKHIQEIYHYSTSFPQVLTYGIEPNISRVKQARKVVDDVLHASYFQCLISNGNSPDSGFQLAFVNPPYDYDKETSTDGTKERLEVTFLKRTTQKLCTNGVLIWVVPQWIVERGASYLSRWYTDIKVFRFPDDPFATPEMVENKQPPVPMFDLFKQVIVLGTRRRWDGSDSVTEKELIKIGISTEPREDIPLMTVLSTQERYRSEYSVPVASGSLKFWSPSKFDPEEAATQLAIPQGTHVPSAGVYSKLQYRTQHWPTDLDRNLSMGRPLAPLKRAFIAIMAVAGMINGATLEGKDGRTIIVKGFSRKRTVTKQSEDEEHYITEKKDVFDTALWCIDMTPGDGLGKLIRIEAGSPTTSFELPHETMTLGAFLDNYGAALALKLAENNPALYDSPAQVPWSGPAFAQMKRQPKGRQRDFVLSIVNAMAVGGGKDWNRMNRVGEIAEMATGKTYLSLATMFLGDTYLNGCAEKLPEKVTPIHLSPAVIMCPEIIAYKWKREAEITLPSVSAIVIQRIDTPEKSRELKQFDPFWRGEKLSAVGCIERVVKRIKVELEDWQQRYDEAKLEGNPLPLKPAHLVIIPNNTAKLGMNWTPVYRLAPLRTMSNSGRITVQHDEATKLVKLVPCCPSCFSPVKDRTRIEKLMKTDPEYKKRREQLERRKRNGGKLSAHEEELEENDGAYVTEAEIWGSADKHKKRWCGSCNEPLWQNTNDKSWSSRSVLKGDEVEALPLPRSLDNLPAAVRDTSYRRFSVADYIKKFHSGFFKLLISDEIHQGKEGTALDFARRSLMAACGSYLGLTGTLCNGYASSLFPFAWSVNPGVRDRFSYDGAREWVDKYGARKTVIKVAKETDDDGDGAISKRRTGGGKAVEHEMAAFAPSGLPEMFTYSAFLELKDVTPFLPPYNEEIDIVPMEGLLGEAYESFESTITSELAQMLAKGDKRALGSWFQCLRRYPNMPYVDTVCSIKKTGQVLGTAAKLSESVIYPKEQRIIDIVQSELEQDRKVLIYVEETGTYDIQPRYRDLIERFVKPRNGAKPNVAILRSGNTLGREALLRKHVDSGCNVLICNSSLVQVGLDLVDFQTIIAPSIPTSTSQMRQSHRRICRLGQTKHMKVIMLVYPTMEYRLLQLMAKKMQTAFMVEGQLPDKGLVSFNDSDDGGDGDFQIALARQVKASLDKGQGSNAADILAEALELQRQFKELEAAALEQNEYIIEEVPPQQVPLAENHNDSDQRLGRACNHRASGNDSRSLGGNEISGGNHQTNESTKEGESRGASQFVVTPQTAL